MSGITKRTPKWFIRNSNFESQWKTVCFANHWYKATLTRSIYTHIYFNFVLRFLLLEQTEQVQFPRWRSETEKKTTVRLKILYLLWCSYLCNESLLCILWNFLVRYVWKDLFRMRLAVFSFKKFVIFKKYSTDFRKNFNEKNLKEHFVWISFIVFKNQIMIFNFINLPILLFSGFLRWLMVDSVKSQYV